jgi:hypothetical protein
VTSPIDLGQVAYEAYSVSAEGKSLVTGDALPDWSGLPDRVQESWRHAAEAVQRRLGAERSVID